MTSLAGRMLATIRRRALCRDGARVVVAVSGGSDSVALALLMAELSAAGVVHLAGLAHLNHGLRGADSDRDAEFCARVAEDCGVPLDVELCDVAEVASGRGRSLEEAAREVRSRGNRSDAGTAPTVRDAERLVQVEMAHVGAEGTGSG